MFTLKNKIHFFKGFTIIELVMVIVVVGILATVAITRYVDLQTEAFIAAERGVVRGVRSGLVTYYADQKEFPSTLDSASDGAASDSNQFFTNILEYGVTENWTKSGTTYTGPAGGSYTYDNSNGSFS